MDKKASMSTLKPSSSVKRYSSVKSAEKSPQKVNQLKKLLTSTGKSSGLKSAVKASDDVIVQLKSGPLIKIVKSCSKNNKKVADILEKSEAPQTKPRKSKESQPRPSARNVSEKAKATPKSRETGKKEKSKVTRKCSDKEKVACKSVKTSSEKEAKVKKTTPRSKACGESEGSSSSSTSHGACVKSTSEQKPGTDSKKSSNSKKARSLKSEKGKDTKEGENSKKVASKPRNTTCKSKTATTKLTNNEVKSTSKGTKSLKGTSKNAKASSAETSASKSKKIVKTPKTASKSADASKTSKKSSKPRKHVTINENNNIVFETPDRMTQKESSKKANVPKKYLSSRRDVKKLQDMIDEFEEISLMDELEEEFTSNTSDAISDDADLNNAICEEIQSSSVVSELNAISISKVTSQASSTTEVLSCEEESTRIDASEDDFMDADDEEMSNPVEDGEHDGRVEIVNGIVDYVSENTDQDIDVDIEGLEKSFDVLENQRQILAAKDVSAELYNENSSFRDAEVQTSVLDSHAIKIEPQSMSDNNEYIGNPETKACHGIDVTLNCKIKEENIDEEKTNYKQENKIEEKVKHYLDGKLMKLDKSSEKKVKASEETNKPIKKKSSKKSRKEQKMFNALKEMSKYFAKHMGGYESSDDDEDEVSSGELDESDNDEDDTSDCSCSDCAESTSSCSCSECNDSSTESSSSENRRNKYDTSTDCGCDNVHCYLTEH